MDRRTDLHESSRASIVDGDPDDVRAVVASGRAGPQWYVDAAPFVFRGALDRLVGGRGRHRPPPGRELLATGDRAGFWLVEESAASALVLRAEVRAPGVVRLRTSWSAVSEHRTRVTQSVGFEPTGLVGRAYLLVDLPAREAVIELTHRRLLRDLRQPSPA